MEVIWLLSLNKWIALPFLDVTERFGLLRELESWGVTKGLLGMEGLVRLRWDVDWIEQTGLL